MSRAGLPDRWTPPADEGGAAGFVAVLERYTGLIERERSSLPERLELAFLGAMGVSLLPASPARVPLVFTLAGDAPIDVALAADSTVAAVVAPPLPGTGSPGSADGGSEPVTFSTDDAVALARARLVCVQSVVPAADRYADHSAGRATGFTAFGDLAQLPHHLYLGHARLFDLDGPAQIDVQVGISGALRGTPVVMQWEYLTTAGWRAFEPVVDLTRGLTQDGLVRLRKSSNAPIVKTTVDGVESHWIRARVAKPLPDGALPVVDRIRASVQLLHEDLPADVALADGFGVDTSKDFLPFGRRPQIGSALLIGCDDAFRREGSRIGIRIEPSVGAGVTASEAGTCALAWEVSTGDGTWAVVRSGKDEQFADGSARTVWFERPDEWQPAAVAGERRRWLRVRIAEAGYGEDAPTAASAVATPRAPSLARLSIGYAYATPPTRLEHVRSMNRFELADHADQASFGRDGFAPFRVSGERHPTIELGFDGPLPIGLVSLFVDVPGDAEAAGVDASPFTWEYRADGRWVDLPVRDGTSGLRTRGMVQFIGQPDLSAADGPDGPLYWIRARLTSGTAVPDAVPVAALHLNAVWATHRSVVRRELVGTADGSPRQALALRQGSILRGETVEVQEWHGTGTDWESRFADVPADRLRLDRDASGRVTGAWVRWEGRAHLHASGPDDRHYAVDRVTGRLHFGDGDLGRMPPAGAAIRADYEHGGGAEGNLPAGSVTQLLSAAASVEGVTNPVPATGGAAGEASVGVAPGARDGRGMAGSGVWARGPQQLRHRGRAIAASDAEWLAREASPEVAIARCLPVTGPRGVRTPGWSTVVISPWGDEPEPQPSAELLRRVHAHVAARLPAAVAGQLRVIGPNYLPISVTADIVIADPAAAASVQARLLAALDRFLHPLHGGRAATGWAFGEDVPLSQVAAVVEGAQGVAFAASLHLTTPGGAMAGELVAVPDDRLPAAGRHLLRLRVEGR